ncbi:MAG: hypothetical protein U1F77_18390 [Kiritimatiellia bacterium]
MLLLRQTYHFLHRSLLAAVFAAAAALLCSVRDAANTLAPPAGAPDHDYWPDVRALAEAGDVAGALCLCDAVAAVPGAPNAAVIAQFGRDLREKHRGTFAAARRFAAGFFTGSLQSGEEVAGTLASDFLFVGDLRDLALQGVARWNGEATDPVLVALSSAGLASSIAAFIPVTTEVAAPADAGLGLVKGLRRAGSLTEGFAGEVVTLARAADRADDARRLGAVMADVLAVAWKAPSGTLRMVMRHVNGAEDLAVLRRWVDASPRLAAASLQVAGADGLRWMARWPGAASGDLLIRVLRKGPSGFRLLAAAKAGGKLLRKMDAGDLHDLLARELVLRPAWLRASAWGMWGAGVLAGLHGLAALAAFRPVKKTQ